MKRARWSSLRRVRVMRRTMCTRFLLFPLFLLPACVGLPEFTPGVTRRADVLLALGEPVLALDGDTVLMHAWANGGRQLLTIPAHRLYRRGAGGVLRRTDLVLPETNEVATPGQRPLPVNHVVHEFDADGILRRRLP